MRILILTQNDNVYLPTSVAKVCRARQADIVCVAVAPAMSTHGGSVRGFLRHLRFFGLMGTAGLARRVIAAKLRAKLSRPRPHGPCHSVAAVCQGFGVPCQEVIDVNSEELHKLVDRYQPDLLVSMSCPQVIGKKVRERFPKGCINVHGAPLPRYRGLMPAFWVLRNAEAKTAATVHDLGEELDDGDILVQREVPILPEDTWDSLVRRTKAAGAEAMIEAIVQIENDTAARRPNRDEDATYFSFPSAKDRKVFFAAGRKFF